MICALSVSIVCVATIVIEQADVTGKVQQKEHTLCSKKTGPPNSW